MNSKAESFKKFVSENHQGVFQIEELEGDKQEAFNSQRNLIKTYKTI